MRPLSVVNTPPQSLGNASNEADNVFRVALRRTQGLEAARECWREALRIFAGLGAPQADDLRARLTGTLDAP